MSSNFGNMCLPQYHHPIKQRKSRFSYTFSLGNMILELHVIKLKKKKGFEII